MNRKFLSPIFAAIALLFAVHTNAQTTSKPKTGLTGTVIGVDGRPVAHAAVSCQSSGGVSPHAVHTDAKGKFVIAGLKQDSYDLRASAPGANSVWHRNIPLKRGQTKEVTLRLEPATESPAAMPVKKQDEQPRQ
jgi:hypothetical protein